MIRNYIRIESAHKKDVALRGFFDNLNKYFLFSFNLCKKNKTTFSQ